MFLVDWVVYKHRLNRDKNRENYLFQRKLNTWEFTLKSV